MSSVLEQNASARIHSASSLLRPRRFSYNRSSRCSCQPSKYSLTLNNAPGLRVLLNTSSLNHHKDCPLSNYSKSEKLFKIRLWYCGGILAQAIEASIHLTRGAGGFSISPNLSFSCVVPSNSNAFRLFRSYDLIRGPRPQDLDVLIESLSRLFQDGKASPRDVDEDGNSLLHVSYLIYCIPPCFN